ncbi:unnamed protein product, partial [Allacma fusca]
QEQRVSLYHSQNMGHLGAQQTLTTMRNLSLLTSYQYKLSTSSITKRMWGQNGESHWENCIQNENENSVYFQGFLRKPI